MTSTSPISVGISSSALAAISRALSVKPGPPPHPRRASWLHGRRRAVVLLDRFRNTGLRRDDGLHVVARHELHVVHREDVGRIGHRDRQRRAGAAERHDLILPSSLGRHQLDDGGIDLELVERNRRHAILLRQQGRDLVVLDIAQLDEIRAELAPVLPLIRQGILELLCGDALLLEKQFANSDRHLVPRNSIAPQRSTTAHPGPRGPGAPPRIPPT